MISENVAHRGMVRSGLMMFCQFVGITLCAAGLDDVCVSFSTQGPDRYSDGSAVLDGECYCLVWSEDGKFEGFTAGGNCADQNDLIVMAAPVASNGRCPEVLFQIPAETAQKLSGGKYAVYLLDTRADASGAVKPSGVRGGVPAMVNGYGEITSGVKIGEAQGYSFPVRSGKDEESGNVASAVASADDGCVQPKIKSMRVDGDNVYLTVQNLEGYMRVQNGVDVKAGDSTGAAVKTGGPEPETILVAPRRGKSGFYKVIRNN
jgi:hypothetical protein